MNDCAPSGGTQKNDSATKLTGKPLFVLELAHKLSSVAESYRHTKTERLHQGCCNLGKRAIGTGNMYLKDRALAEPAQKHWTLCVRQGG